MNSKTIQIKKIEMAQKQLNELKKDTNKHLNEIIYFFSKKR
jgi:hypothetical protein